jgi:anti-anti-sigma factor
MMGLTTIRTSQGNVIKVDVDENLDVSVHSLFVQACEAAAGSGAAEIAVNMRKARHVRDSGLAMLLMLRERAGRLGDTVRLVNCSPAFKRQLLAHRLDAHFSLR